VVLAKLNAQLALFPLVLTNTKSTLQNASTAVLALVFAQLALQKLNNFVL